MKHLQVTCAIIEREGCVLAAQRSAKGSMPLKWEFPGGKIRNGESPRECLRRELREELGIEVEIRRCLAASMHEYLSFAITLHPFVCTIQSGKPLLYEHAAIAWLKPQELHSLDWADADVAVVEAYLRDCARLGDMHE